MMTFILLMTLIGPGASLQDHELNQVATFKTELACQEGARQIAEKQLDSIDRNRRLKGKVSVEYLCLPQG